MAAFGANGTGRVGEGHGFEDLAPLDSMDMAWLTSVPFDLDFQS